MVDEQPAPSTSQVIKPIIAAGDAIGSVILMGKTDKDIPGASEKLLAQTAAGFLGRQMEQLFCYRCSQRLDRTCLKNYSRNLPVSRNKKTAVSI